MLSNRYNYVVADDNGSDEVRANFSKFLTTFIHKNGLKSEIIETIPDILVCI